MKNNTKIKISKKYEDMLDEIHLDEDGYWAYTSEGFCFSDMESHTAHEPTQKDLLNIIKTIQKCNCKECYKN